MQVGDLAKIVRPSFIGDSHLIIDAWHDGTPVLILKESNYKLHDGKHKEIVLIQHGEITTWIPKEDLEPYK